MFLSKPNSTTIPSVCVKFLTRDFPDTLYMYVPRDFPDSRDFPDLDFLEKFTNLHHKALRSDLSILQDLI